MKKKYDEDKLAKTFMPAVIRRYRDAAGLSQQELADRVGISKSYISSLELGYRAPSLNLLVKIAQTLEVKAGKMVDEMVEAMTSTIIESEKRTGEIPVQPRNERSVSILERVAAARAQYKLRSTGIDISIVEA